MNNENDEKVDVIILERSYSVRIKKKEDKVKYENVEILINEIVNGFKRQYGQITDEIQLLSVVTLRLSSMIEDYKNEKKEIVEHLNELRNIMNEINDQ